MLSFAFKYLGVAFLLSELALAIWRRSSTKANSTDTDGGSLRLLWIVISASITVGALLSAYGVKPWLPTGYPWVWIGVSVFVSAQLYEGGPFGTSADFSP